MLTKGEKGGNITKLSLEAGKGDKLKKLEKSRKRVLTKAWTSDNINKLSDDSKEPWKLHSMEI